ncbi:MAG: type II toxin-antitoxin system RelE/ParE family toxin [Zoogloeaceae bacterium]|nr:type II toxin-antitoxin system RelE/ParE family toxin [Zoogloeaceae bacterium]
MNTIMTTEVFDAWFAGLRDKIAKRRIQARIRLAELGNFGDAKPVGGGVSELRVHVGAGYRVYVKQKGAVVYVLLTGGDKSTQEKDTETALRMAQELGD